MASLIMLTGSSGIFGCCAALLPSSSAMCFVTISTACFIRALAAPCGSGANLAHSGLPVLLTSVAGVEPEDRVQRVRAMRGTVACMVAAVLLAWPFVGLLALPMAVGLGR